MARPTQHRTITKRVRLNSDEAARLMADAAEATNGDFSELARRRMLDGKPLMTGKGMTRSELVQTLDDIGYIRKAIQGGQLVSAEQVIEVVSDRIYKALRRDL